MTDRFLSRVAIVSGAGSGIGKAVAEAFATEGGKVALVGRTREKLEAVASLLPTGSALVLAGRHEDPVFARSAAAATFERFGRIDLLFNNAGSYSASGVAECSDDRWNDALASNLSGPFRMTREVLPFFREQKSGVIINNSSTLGLKPIAGAAPYCVAKAGLVMLTRSTALEEAEHGIRVNCICPGVVDTPIHRDRVGGDARALESFLDEAGSLHPLGRVGSPQEIAALTLFLASDESPWTTGAVVTIDGGISLT